MPADALAAAPPSLLGKADYVVVRSGEGALREILLRLRALDPAIQIVLVADEERRAEVARRLLFTPGAGEVWVVSSEELGEELYARAAEVTRRRRSYPATRARLLRGLERVGNGGPGRRISDAFLAALQEVVPEPVLSLDDSGRVVTANPAAEALLDRREDELEGASLVELLRTEDRTALEAILEQGREARADGEVRYCGPAGEVGVVEVAVVPVRAGRHRVRCLVLRDVSEARRLLREREDQAQRLAEEVAAREQVNRTLSERTDELERALAARSRFYASISHELRTPLNAILGYQSLLLEGMFGRLPQEASGPLRRAQGAAAHLLELVQDLLDLSMIESGHVELELETVRLPDFLSELADTVRPFAESHDTVLQIEDPGEERSIVTDPRRLRQILLNLLTNAVKFGRGRPVRLRYGSAPDGGTAVHVVDQGQGIPAARLEQIFDEFVRLENSGDPPGSGLGLTISQRLADAIGARIEVESDVGRGSEFRVLLPAQPHSPAPEGRGAT